MKMASSTTLFGIVFATAIFSAGVLTDRLTNVYITNLPLDEQGNLTVKVAEKPLQTYNDTIEITVLDWTSHVVNGRELGAVLSDSFPFEVSFAFNPKQQFLKITDVWMNMIATVTSDTTYVVRFDITFNSQMTISTGGNDILDVSNLDTVPIHIEDQNVYQVIAQGVNTLALSKPEWFDGQTAQWMLGVALYIYKATVFIEYEYQA